MTRPVYLHTITREDVGRRSIKCPSTFSSRRLLPTNVGGTHTVCVASAIGRILHIDIGKRVYAIPGNGGGSAVIQVENNEQRDSRTQTVLQS